MPFEQFPTLESRYLKKEKCDKLEKYVASTGDAFIFQGEIISPGHYNVRVFYDPQRALSKKDIREHYRKLLEIMVTNMK